MVGTWFVFKYLNKNYINLLQLNAEVHLRPKFTSHKDF